MGLLTEQISKKLSDNGQPENKDKDHAPVVKLFLPGTAFTWLLSELDYEEPDIAFGLCDLGMGFPELGTVRVSELEALRINDVYCIEQDMHFEPEYPMSVYAFAANAAAMITTDKICLNIAAEELKRRKGSHTMHP